MLASGESIILVVSDKPSMHLARRATEIGLEAWQDRLTNRSDSELRHALDPSRPEQTYQQMRQAAKVGRFASVLAIAHDGEMPAAVGVAWGADDVSGSWLQRRIKRTIYRQKPYAWLAQTNVQPIYQRQLIGTSLVDTLLKQFKSDQKPTAYVFHENQPTLEWYRDDLGFYPTPTSPVSREYFGPDAEPILQWRLQANSIADVRAQISKRYGKLPYDQIEQQKY